MTDWSSDPEMVKLKREFLDLLFERASELENWLAKGHDHCSRSGVEPIKMIVHKIAGSAGSYGFIDLGDRASVLDETLFETNGIDETIWQGLQALLLELKNITRTR